MPFGLKFDPTACSPSGPADGAQPDMPTLYASDASERGSESDRPEPDSAFEDHYSSHTDDGGDGDGDGVESEALILRLCLGFGA